MKIPEHAEKIIELLEEQGFEAYLVGGCVRDMLLGREPEDWDITSNARPEQVKSLFRRTIDTGIQHGTVTVMMDQCGYEVTTYRIDGEYEDSRHPKEVLFTAELAEDLRRRDFTINAMAYHHKRGLVDIFGGQEDLQGKVIRCVGNPEERFSEDALRIMRAVRFAGQLGFVIEEATLEAAKKLAPTLSNISAERVRTELVKLLESPHPELLLVAWEQGITKVILPEFDRMMETEQNNPHHCYTVGMHSMKALQKLHFLWKEKKNASSAFSVLQAAQAEPDQKKAEEDKKRFRCLCLAALLHDVAKPEAKTTDEAGIDHFHGHPEIGENMARQILRRLKFDNETVDRVRRLIRWHDYRYSEKKKGMRHAIHNIGSDLMEDLFLLQRCDVLAQNPEKMEDKLRILEEAEKLFLQIQQDKECTDLKMLAVSGKDLIAAGFRPGKALGETLGLLLEHVLENPEDNERTILLALAEKLLAGEE